jgi:hypothetical protein
MLSSAGQDGDLRTWIAATLHAKKYPKHRLPDQALTESLIAMTGQGQRLAGPAYLVVRAAVLGE